MEAETDVRVHPRPLTPEQQGWLSEAWAAIEPIMNQPVGYGGGMEPVN